MDCPYIAYVLVLGHLFEESGLQILAIQEHRILHDEPIKRTQYKLQLEE